MSRILLSVVLVSSIFVSTNAAATCWYPDGRTSEPDHVPCNQTGTAASACCDPLDSCSSSGYCLGRSGWLYRGSCTDQAWESPNCAKQQSACVTNPITKRAFNSWNPLWSCNQPGTPASDFCCGYGSTSCCNSSFVLGTTGSAFKPGVDAFVANLTSGNATPTPIANANAIANTSANTSTPDAAKSSDNSELGTKVGLGVGIPLGVLVLGLLALLFWRERSRRSYKGIDTPMNSVNNNVSGAMAGQYMHNDQEQRQNSYQSNGSMVGTGSVYQQQVSPAQTYQSPVQKMDQYSFAPTYEAPANTAPQELSTSR